MTVTATNAGPHEPIMRKHRSLRLIRAETLPRQRPERNRSEKLGGCPGVEDESAVAMLACDARVTLLLSRCAQSEG